MASKNDQNDVETEKIDVGIEATSLPLFDSRKQLTDLSDELFTNLNNYIGSEFELNLDEYKLLETMNNCMQQQYHGMKDTAENVLQMITELDKKYEQMSDKLKIIDKLDSKVTRIEKMAYAIDAYSKRLEKQYKLLEKGLNDLGQQPSSTSTATSSTE